MSAWSAQVVIQEQQSAATNRHMRFVTVAEKLVEKLKLSRIPEKVQMCVMGEGGEGGEDRGPWWQRKAFDSVHNCGERNYTHSSAWTSTPCCTCAEWGSRRSHRRADGTSDQPWLQQPHRHQT
jgi:hypothetical protein